MSRENIIYKNFQVKAEHRIFCSQGTKVMVEDAGSPPGLSGACFGIFPFSLTENI